MLGDVEQPFSFFVLASINQLVLDEQRVFIRQEPASHGGTRLGRRN